MRNLFGLPVFGALVPAVWCLSYAVTGLIVGANVGRQSSTSGVAPFLAFIAIPLLALVGSALGRGARHVLTPAFRSRWARPMKWSMPALLMLIAAAAAWHAGKPILAAEREARPRVIVDAARLQKSAMTVRMDGVVRASRVYEYVQKVNSVISWAEGSAHLANVGNTLQISLQPTGQSVAVPLPGIDYINYVDAVTLRSASGRPTLALLITGRTTGRRDLLAVISGSGELMYLELLERFWDFRSSPLAVAPSPAGDVIIVGSEPRNVLLFTPPSGGPLPQQAPRDLAGR